MNKLGNIVVQKSDLRLMNKVDFIHYCSDLTDIIPDLPTLIVGWKYVKTLYPGIQLSILKEGINEKIWWCFAPMEKNSKHIECLEQFYQNIINTIRKKITYHFINIFNADISNIKEIITALNSNTRVVCYVNYQFMYVYFNDQVFGFNFDDIEYIGISKNRIMKKFHNNSENSIFYKADFIQDGIMQLLKNNLYLIPIFYDKN